MTALELVVIITESGFCPVGLLGEGKATLREWVEKFGEGGCEYQAVQVLTGTRRVGQTRSKDEQIVAERLRALKAWRKTLYGKH